MSILSFITSIFKPASDLIDSLHVSEEERGKLRNELAKIQSAMHEKSIELMSSEARSDHWIVASWRPITMIILITMIMLGAFGVIVVPKEIYDLFEIFGSAYAGGRSLEKVARVWKS